MSKNTGPSIETSLERFLSAQQALEYWVPTDFVPDEPRTQYDDGYEVGRVYINGVLLGSTPEPGHAFGRGGTRRNNYDAHLRLQSVLQDAIRIAREAEEGTEELVLDELVVVRMQTNVSGQGMDVHLRFKLNKKELWGVFRRYGIDRLPKFSSELNSVVLDKVANGKLTGVIRNTLDKWLTPKSGFYKCLAPAVRVLTLHGDYMDVHRGTVVEVLRSTPDKLRCNMRIQGQDYTLSGDEYLRFNYWFEKK